MEIDTKEIYIQTLLTTVTVAFGAAQLSRITNVYKTQLEIISGVAISTIPVLTTVAMIHTNGLMKVSLYAIKYICLSVAGLWIRNKFEEYLF